MVNRSFLMLTCLGCAALSACAPLNRDNTPALNWVEAHAWPETKGARIAAAPLVFPVGLAAVTADAFVIHPATEINDAADDTRDCLWDDLDWQDEYMTECAALPWRTVATPLVFAGDLIGRSLFDIPDRADEVRQVEDARKAIKEIRALLDAGKPNEAWVALPKITNLHDAGELLREEAELLSWEVRFAAGEIRVSEHRFMGIYDAGELKSIPTYMFPADISQLSRLLDGPMAAQARALLDRMESSPDPAARWAARLALIIGKDQDLRRAAYERSLRDESAVLRWLALRELNSKEKPPEIEQSSFMNILKSMAQTDPDPLVRADSQKLLDTQKQASP